MIDIWHRRVLLLEDDYPGYNYEESKFIKESLKAHGYEVKTITVKMLAGEWFFYGNVGRFNSGVIIVPNSQNLPLKTTEILRRYNEGHGSVLFLGGPLYYNLVEDVDGKYTNRPLGDKLDATFTQSEREKYVREGVCPSFKTYTTKKVSKLKASPNQNIFNKELKVEFPIAVTVPCETGVSGGFERGATARFIPIVDCYDDADATNPITRGRDNGRRGSFAFIGLERTSSCGCLGKSMYGYVDCTAIGSTVAQIGAQCPLQEVSDGGELLCAMVDRLMLGAYLMEGGADGIRYYKNEDMKVGAEILNAVHTFKRLTCRITVKTDDKPIIFEKSILASPHAISKISFIIPFTEIQNQIRFGVDYTIDTELYLDDCLIDKISSAYSYETPQFSKDENDFVRAVGHKFSLNGKPWYMASINYWPTHYQAKERSDYWKGMFHVNNYNAEEIEKDLAYMEEIGLNSVAVRLDFVALEDSKHGLRDFLLRCERHNLKVVLAVPKIVDSKFFDGEALEELFKIVPIAGNPTVMVLEIEWESSNDMYSAIFNAEFNDVWQNWIEKRYGSVERAEKALGITFERDIFGYICVPNYYEIQNRELAKIVRNYVRDFDDECWSKMLGNIRPQCPYQFIANRQGAYMTRGKEFAHHDLIMPEGYAHEDSGFVGEEQTAYATISALIERYETNDKPVVWAEFGASVCGFAWKKNVRYDHENHSYYPENVERQVTFNREMFAAMEESDVAGTMPWWWPANFRFTEMADLGYMNTDGLLTQSGQEYVAFCARMKEKTSQPTQDKREKLIVKGNVDNYLEGKEAFVREVCMPAYFKAKKENLALEIQTEYDE